MDALVDLLIQRETIDGAEFTALVDQHEQEQRPAAMV
jgi:hypothetical protein